MVGDRLKLSTSSQFIDTAENISRNPRPYGACAYQEARDSADVWSSLRFSEPLGGDGAGPAS